MRTIYTSKEELLPFVPSTRLPAHKKSNLRTESRRENKLSYKLEFLIQTRLEFLSTGIFGYNSVLFTPVWAKKFKK